MISLICLGKGAPEYWAAVIKPGRIFFEIGGVDIEAAQEAIRLAMHKLPIKAKCVVRRDYVGECLREKVCATWREHASVLPGPQSMSKGLGAGGPQ